MPKLESRRLALLPRATLGAAVALTVALVLASGAGVASAQDEIPADRYPGLGFEILDPDERPIFESLATGELCPCPGAPRSLSACLQAESCSLAREVAWLMFRRIKEDASTDDIRDEVVRFLTEASTPREFDLTGTPVRGPADAPVQIVVFSDFQCPHCRMFVETSERLVEEFGDQVAIYYKHFPLPSHSNAMQCARAANAAGMQGKFWEMHDLIFENQSRVNATEDIDGLITELAREVGLDMDRFARDYADAAMRARAEADRDQGRAAGVRATPTCYINGLMYHEAETFEAMQAHVQQLLEAAGE